MKTYQEIPGIPLRLRVYNEFLRDEIVDSLELNRQYKEKQLPLLDFLIRFAEKYTGGDIEKAESLLKNPLVTTHLEASANLFMLNKAFEEEIINFEGKCVTSMLNHRTTEQQRKEVCEFLDIELQDWEDIIKVLPSSSFIALAEFYQAETSRKEPEVKQSTSPKLQGPRLKGFSKK